MTHILNLDEFAKINESLKARRAESKNSSEKDKAEIEKETKDIMETVHSFFKFLNDEESWSKDETKELLNNVGLFVYDGERFADDKEIITFDKCRFSDMASTTDGVEQLVNFFVKNSTTKDFNGSKRKKMLFNIGIGINEKTDACKELAKNIKEELEDSKNSFCGIYDTENVKLKLRQFKDLEYIENKKAPVPPQIKPTVFVWFPRNATDFTKIIE